MILSSGLSTPEAARESYPFRRPRPIKNGNRKSQIIPTRSPGTIVTVPRSIVQYVATEFGIVQLKGKSTWERAEALISIAHPDFREDLILEAEKMGIWKQTKH